MATHIRPLATGSFLDECACASLSLLVRNDWQYAWSVLVVLSRDLVICSKVIRSLQLYHAQSSGSMSVFRRACLVWLRTSYRVKELEGKRFDFLLKHVKVHISKGCGGSHTRECTLIPTYAHDYAPCMFLLSSQIPAAGATWHLPKHQRSCFAIHSSCMLPQLPASATLPIPNERGPRCDLASLPEGFVWM